MSYDWSAGNIPQISPHSLAKHKILSEYVKRYIQILTNPMRGADDFVITLVDGFAGGGKYIDSSNSAVTHPGSPLILIDSVIEAELKINVGRTKKMKIDSSFIFIEKNKESFLSLNLALKEKLESIPIAPPILLNGEFEENLDRIIGHVKSRKRSERVIFVLDQYGYSDVPASVLAKIFSELPNAEIFLTLAVDCITNYGLNIHTAANRLGAPKEITDRLIFGPEDVFEVDNVDQRATFRVLQQLLSLTYTEGIGSRYYTPFFITSRDSNRSYWFLHLANSSKANDVVKVIHWELENNFVHFGKSGLSMLGFDPNKETKLNEKPLFDFSNTARESTKLALMDELPRKVVSDHKDGISFVDLFTQICNETPATKQIVQEVISELCKEKQLVKEGAEGVQRAAKTLPHDDDVIKSPNQTYFSFSK
jgi:three-Cys-motif partner protein